MRGWPARWAARSRSLAWARARSPTARPRALAQALATSADMLVLRDDASAAVLARAGAPQPMRVAADAAWTLFEPPAPRSPAPDGPVIVTLSRHAGGGRDTAAFAGGLAELLAARPELDEIVLEPWQVGGPGRDDLDLARDLQRALRVVTRREFPIAPPPASITAAGRAYGRARLVLGQRFHSLVAAAAAGTPFVAVAHEAKCADLAVRLGQRALAPGCPVGDVAPTLAAALDGPCPAPDTVGELIESAHTMLALMRTVVEGGRSGIPQDTRALRLQPEALVR